MFPPTMQQTRAANDQSDLTITFCIVSYNSVFYVKALVVIVKSGGSFAALQQTAGQAQAKIRSAGLKFEEFTASATGS